MLQSNKKFLIGCLALFVALCGGWFFLFEHGKKWLQKELDSAQVILRQKGYEISYSALNIQGTPLSVKATFHNPHIKDPKGIVDWHGAEIKLSMNLFNPYTLTFSLPGDQTLSLPQNTAYPLGILKFEGGRGTLKVTGKGTLDQATLLVDRLFSLKGEKIQFLSLESLSLNAKNLAHPLALQIYFTSHIKGLPAPIKEGTQNAPLTLSCQASLSGYKGKNPHPHSLAEWRDGGGVLEIAQVKMNWPPVLAEGDGTLTLDKNMYPLGSFSSRIVGYEEALTHMVQLGWVKKNNATMASIVLNMLSQSDEKGNKQITIPITLQDGGVSFGGVPLLKMGH